LAAVGGPAQAPVPGRHHNMAVVHGVALNKFRAGKPASTTYVVDHTQ
jgi:hypothetical protein